MKAIIFGANGQDGYYLSQLLLQKGYEVIGVSRSGNHQNVDLTNFQQVLKFVQQNQADLIFHLAAESTTSHDAWKANHDTISTGSINILEAVYQTCPSSKIFLSGSGLQFVNTGLPISERNEFEASSPYAVSRIHSVYAARYYRKLGLKTYVGYLFNHDSPRRTAKHITRQIVNFARVVQQGGKGKMSIGAPSVKKEWGFAGDIVEGIWTLVSQNAIFEATIGTGKAYSIQRWIDICFGLINIDPTEHIDYSKSFIPEYETLVSDPSTILSLGWKPNLDIEQLAQLMLFENE